MLAIDPGRVRLGLAVSDPLGATAQPHATLASRGLEADARAIAELVRALGVGRIVCGLPIGLDGREGAAAAAARRIAEAVAAATGLPVELADERLTSVAAERTLLALGAGRRTRRAAADRVAATILLQGVLDGAAPRGIVGAEPR